MVPIPATVDLMYKLKARGHSLYCLSNMHFASIEHLERTYDFWDVFTGGTYPVQAVATGDKPSVYVLNKDNIIEQRTVTLGLQTPDKVQIREGLNEGDLVIGVTLIDENHDTCKRRDIVLNRAQSVVQLPGDLIGLVTQKEKAHGLNAMGLAGPDILLLPTAGHLQVAAAQGLDIADDRSNSTIEETKRQILIAEQAALVASFSR